MFLEKMKYILYSISIKKENRNSNIWLFGSPHSNNYFFGNSKYMFLWINKYHPEINSVWISDKKEVVDNLRKMGYESTLKNSKEIKKLSKISKFIFTDGSLSFVDRSAIATAYKIQLWHGIPITKNVFIKSRIKYYLAKYNPLYIKSDFTMVTSELYKKYFECGWPTKAIITGYPRTDILFNNYKFDNLYILDDNIAIYNNILEKKKKFNKIILYLPTYREYDLDFDNILKERVNLKKINEFLRKNNSLLIIKYHPYSNLPKLFINKFKHILFVKSNFDIQPLLKYSDILITDYSSIFVDYLLLNKPVIHFLFDKEVYIKFRKKDGGMIKSYNKNINNYICKNENDLLDTLKKLFDGYDPLNKKRKKMRDLLFKYKDGKSCKRIYKFITSILV